MGFKGSSCHPQAAAQHTISHLLLLILPVAAVAAAAGQQHKHQIQPLLCLGGMISSLGLQLLQLNLNPNNTFQNASPRFPILVVCMLVVVSVSSTVQCLKHKAMAHTMQIASGFLG